MGSPYNDFAEERDQEKMSLQDWKNTQCSHCKSWSSNYRWEMFGKCCYCGKK